ncbi:MAG: prolyl oligopeptidase family serine peptidase [Gemmataceae bacterium]
MRWLLTCVAVLVGLTASRGADLDSLLEKKTFTSGKASLPYRLLKPQGYDGQTAYPLVIFLHGAGERGKDNKAQMKHGVKNFASDEVRKKYPCFVMVPQCPPHPARWADWTATGTTKEPTEPLALVLALLEELKKEYQIDENRIYLTGLSMGGFGTWDLLSRKPDLFAAAIPICGGGDPRSAKKFAHVPIWAFHGAKDNVVRPERSREMIEALKKAGGSPKYTEYPEAGHDSWTKTYADPAVLEWLFAQKRKS